MFDLAALPKRSFLHFDSKSTYKVLSLNRISSVYDHVFPKLIYLFFIQSGIKELLAAALPSTNNSALGFLKTL